MPTTADILKEDPGAPAHATCTTRSRADAAAHSIADVATRSTLNAATTTYTTALAHQPVQRPKTRCLSSPNVTNAIKGHSLMHSSPLDPSSIATVGILFGLLIHALPKNLSRWQLQQPRHPQAPHARDHQQWRAVNDPENVSTAARLQVNKTSWPFEGRLIIHNN